MRMFRRFITNKYFNSYRKMISLRGLTDHTIKSYSTYILAYFDFLTDVIHKSPEDVTWDEMRQFVRWLQDTRSLSDRTMNAVISQLRFFTIYVLHKPWDATQLPFRKFDNYLPYVFFTISYLTFYKSFHRKTPRQSRTHFSFHIILPRTFSVKLSPRYSSQRPFTQ